jgi:hypothetical protein
MSKDGIAPLSHFFIKWSEYTTSIFDGQCFFRFIWLHIKPAAALTLNIDPPAAENLQSVTVPTINEADTSLCFRSAAPSGVPTDV